MQYQEQDTALNLNLQMNQLSIKLLWLSQARQPPTIITQGDRLTILVQTVRDASVLWRSRGWLYSAGFEYLGLYLHDNNDGICPYAAADTKKLPLVTVVADAAAPLPWLSQNYRAFQAMAQAAFILDLDCHLRAFKVAGQIHPQLSPAAIAHHIALPFSLMGQDAPEQWKEQDYCRYQGDRMWKFWLRSRRVSRSEILVLLENCHQWQDIAQQRDGLAGLLSNC